MKLKKSYELSVIISFKNEENVLLELYKRIINSIGNLKYEIIFVNDASTDNSSRILTDLSRTNSRVKVLNTTRSFGNSECVLAGFQHSLGDMVVYLDADLQDPPELIPALIDQMKKQKVDVVHTRRISRLRETFFKMYITKIGYLFLERFSSPSLPQEFGDFKLLSRRAVTKLIQHKESTPFLRGMIENIGYPSSFIDYERQGRFDGKSQTKFKVFSSKWLNNHIYSTLISFNDLPLKFALYVGFAISAFGLISIPVFLLMKYLSIAVPGWTGIMTLIALFGGSQLFVLGILGLYIRSIFVSVKNRPLYIIESIVHNGNLKKVN